MLTMRLKRLSDICSRDLGLLPKPRLEITLAYTPFRMTLMLELDLYSKLYARSYYPMHYLDVEQHGYFEYLIKLDQVLED